jgi:hypothetical protein
MSAPTLARPRPQAGLAASAAVRPHRLERADALALACLAAALTAITLLTWRKWGTPALDAGAELTTADLVAGGATPYEDVRYFYGPAGLYTLALSFKLFGASFTTAFVFGYVQTIAILIAFYALARQWLAPLAAALGTGVVLAIGFSGTAFNFVLPHTNSATFGLLFLLLELLALARGRPLLAGLALGASGLTRPEFAGVAALAAAAWLVAGAREAGGRAALRTGVRLALPGLAIPLVVLGALAASVGVDRLLWENLWPVDFIEFAGFSSQENWAPLTLASAAATAGRALVYCLLLAGVIASALLWQRRWGVARLLALWPLAAALASLGVLAGAARVTGAFPGAREAVESEARHLLIGMSWLPALAFAAAAFALARAVRRGGPPLGRSWPADAALIVVAAVLGFRAYDAFTAEASYAPYYAAPIVLLLAILHQRLADRWPAARGAALAALGAVGLGLAAYAVNGLYSDNTTEVRTARGSFVANDASAKPLQRSLDLIAARTRPGEPILALPSDGGTYFMADRPPALYELMFLPGLLDAPSDERAAIARLRAGRVRYTALSARDFSPYGYETIGEDYNRLLIAAIRRESRLAASYGDPSQPVAGSYPSAAFEIYERP